MEAGETDLLGRDRILNSIVDMGAYENEAPEELMVERITVKAGRTREGQKDSFRLSGPLEAEDPAIITILIDFVKCTFQVVAKNTNRPWEEVPLNFGLQFGDFNEQEEVEF